MTYHRVGDRYFPEEIPCGARSPRMYECILPRGHTDPQHAAGRGLAIVDVWPVRFTVGDRMPAYMINGEPVCAAEGPLSVMECTIPVSVPHPAQHLAGGIDHEILAVWEKYSIGDRDPTPLPLLYHQNRVRCEVHSRETRYLCTWFKGTDHPPVHVAGNDYVILDVWE